MSPPAIVCDGVWKRFRLYKHRSRTIKEKLLSGRSSYDTLWALRGVDLEVPAGSSLAIVGSNGSGKSTLLRVVARVLTPDRGRIHVEGSIASLLDLGIGFHPELTGRENVFLSGVLLGRTRRDIAARYDEIVDFAGIEEFMETPVRNYSAGMYARLAFALATTVEPDVLLIDEVLAVGDERFQAQCRERVESIRRSGRTIVIVSHSLAMVRDLCDHAVWLERGVVRGTGAVDAVATTYAEAAAAIPAASVDI